MAGIFHYKNQILLHLSTIDEGWEQWEPSSTERKNRYLKIWSKTIDMFLSSAYSSLLLHFLICFLSFTRKIRICVVHHQHLHKQNQESTTNNVLCFFRTEKGLHEAQKKPARNQTIFMVSLQLSSARWDPHKNRDTTYTNIVGLFQEDSVNSSWKKQQKKDAVWGHLL